MNKLKSIGQVIFGIVIFLGILLLTYFLIFGAIHIATKINPILIRITNILSAISFFILLPLTIFKKTRSFSAICLYVSSYFFGLSAWVLGLIATYITLGGFWIFIGLMFGGVGVVPMGLIGSVIKGEWSLLLNLLYITVLTFVIRIFVAYLMNKEERASEPNVVYKLKDSTEEKEKDEEYTIKDTDIAPEPILSLKTPSYRALAESEKNDILEYIKTLDPEEFPKITSLTHSDVLLMLEIIFRSLSEDSVEDNISFREHLLIYENILEKELNNKKIT